MFIGIYWDILFKRPGQSNLWPPKSNPSPNPNFMRFPQGVNGMSRSCEKYGRTTWKHNNKNKRLNQRLDRCNKSNLHLALLFFWEFTSNISFFLSTETIVKGVKISATGERRFVFERINSLECTLTDNSQKDIICTSEDLKLQAVTLKGGNCSHKGKRITTATMNVYIKTICNDVQYTPVVYLN